jgi:lysophospholipase L1-like esterase
VRNALPGAAPVNKLIQVVHLKLGGYQMRSVSRGLLLLLLAPLTLKASAQPLAVEAYGDSITAGFLSHTSVTQAPPLKEVSGIISDLAMFFMSGERKHILKQHAPQNSWVALFAKRFDPNGPSLLSNYAVTGARTWQLVSQVRKQLPQKNATRAFFFIGHNDLCNNLDQPEVIADTYEREFNLALREWDKTHHNSDAYLIPVSDIHRVYAALGGQVWKKGTGTQYSCADSWTKFFPYCTSHYSKHKAGTFENYMKPRLEEMNKALDRLALALSKETASNRFHYLKDAHDVPYEPEFFAVDCFHLSPKGQSTLAARMEQMVRDRESP